MKKERITRKNIRSSLLDIKSIFLSFSGDCLDNINILDGWNTLVKLIDISKDTNYKRYLLTTGFDRDIENIIKKYEKDELPDFEQINLFLQHLYNEIKEVRNDKDKKQNY